MDLGSSATNQLPKNPVNWRLWDRLNFHLEYLEFSRFNAYVYLTYAQKVVS